MKIRKTLAALGLVAVLSATAACGAAATGTSSGSSTTTTSSTSSDTSADTSGAAAGSNAAGAGPNAVDVSSVTTEEQLVALVQEAYGDASLGLHRGHQPVESVLDEVLGISHDELHVRMEEQGQNLAAVATDLGIDPQSLVDALVESWSPAIDTLLANGTITQDEADAYRAALEEAFTFRVTWDGQAATPTFSGLEA
ncbi:hypothetical protein [Kineosporia sp. R_H_3]|uniref:hypothetical protein n=1 Tax=Kineosporia sp. R_H_3 TaxID=1961848 RepID=UPI000B4C12B9|nr:hypothetical protein [Kineosporia sp. R_H_3]